MKIHVRVKRTLTKSPMRLTAWKECIVASYAQTYGRLVTLGWIGAALVAFLTKGREGKGKGKEGKGREGEGKGRKGEGRQPLISSSHKATKKALIYSWYVFTPLRVRYYFTQWNAVPTIHRVQNLPLLWAKPQFGPKLSSLVESNQCHDYLGREGKGREREGKGKGRREGTGGKQPMPWLSSRRS